MSPKTPQICGAVFALLGVTLGAFGAHAIKPLLEQNKTWDVWQTAVHYQWFHALALLALGGQLKRGPVVCWVVGTLCFSGSLYFLATNPDQRWAGPVTPLGGLLFIVGWIWFILNIVRRKD